MRLDDKIKVAKWLEDQIQKLKALPGAGLIRENIERLEEAAADLWMEIRLQQSGTMLER